ncbi:MAG: zinc ribbon domain-containing protein [Chloroflexi bacterium]|nr:MAG: zinc ribbon domain-containing protein [Chloroflexota bacterium]
MPRDEGHRYTHGVIAPCSNCGAENAPGARFCSSCGTALAPRCPNCRSEVSPGARFCQTCGHPLSAEAPGLSTWSTRRSWRIGSIQRRCARSSRRTSRSYRRRFKRGAEPSRSTSVTRRWPSSAFLECARTMLHGRSAQPRRSGAAFLTWRPTSNDNTASTSRSGSVSTPAR